MYKYMKNNLQQSNLNKYKLQTVRQKKEGTKNEEKIDAEESNNNKG